MAAHVPVPPTIIQFQKPGTRVFSGLEECALSHFRAISLLARCFRSCYGPAGRRKLLVAQPGLPMVIGGVRAVLPKLEIEHPAGILARQACRAQEQECGDGTNAVLQLAGALMAEAETLLRHGMPASDLCAGYRLACAHACRKLEELSFDPWENWPRWAGPYTHLRAETDELSTEACEVTGMTSPPSSCTMSAPGNGLVSGRQPWRDSQVPVCLGGAMLQYSLASTVSDDLIFQLQKGTLQGLVDWASALPKDVEPETMEVLGFTGGTLEDSWIFKGAIMQLEPLGTRMRVTDAQLAVYACPFGERKTRLSCTTLIEYARELETLRPGIERVEEERVEALRQVGVTVLAVAGAVSELALHFCNHAQILVVKLERLSQARQLALASGARALTTDHAPGYGELGKCRRVYPSEIGGFPVMAFESCPQAGKGLVTMVVRGSTPELVNYAKESVKAALQLFAVLREDPRMVAGAGATDIQLGIELEKAGKHFPFPKQQGFLAFARALECLPQALAGNWGLDIASVLGDLRARHETGETNVGVEENGATTTKVIDSFTVKKRALELATDVAMTLIGCAQVVVAKKSGGPRFRKENRNWDLESDFVDESSDFLE